MTNAHIRESLRIPERAVVELTARMRKDWALFRILLFQNLALYGRVLNEVPHLDISKAIVSSPRLGVLPHKETIDPVDDVRALVFAHFDAALGTTPQWQARWSHAGLQPPRPLFFDTLRDAHDAGYVMGSLSEEAELRTTWKEIAHTREEMGKPLLSRVGAYATQVALRDAGANIKSFGARIAGASAEVSLEIERQVVREKVSHFLAGVLIGARTEKPVRDWRQLARDLYRELKDTGDTRDWERVAITEIRRAVNTGKLVRFLDRKVEYVQAVVQPNACDGCQKLYLNPDGTAKKFPINDLISTIISTGGMNIGRTQARIGTEEGWIPNAVVHPWCQCRFIPAR